VEEQWEKEDAKGEEREERAREREIGGGGGEVGKMDGEGVDA